jgi:hypothetical protein
MDHRTPPPVSLAHPCLGKVFTREGKTWKVAAVNVSGGSFWAWCVNMKNRMDQMRLSCDAIPL